MIESIKYNNSSINGFTYDEVKKAISKIDGRILSVERFRNINFEDKKTELLTMINERPAVVTIGDKTFNNIVDILIAEDYSYAGIMNLEIRCSVTY